MRLNSDQKYLILFFVIILVPILWMTIGMYPHYSQESYSIHVVKLNGPAMATYGMGDHPLWMYVGSLVGCWLLVLVLLLPLCSDTKEAGK